MDADRDRPHRSNSSNNSCSSNNSSSSTSELFICFTSRLSSSSSSSMKISSKSILSPGRARESSQISLSNSLSRRLKTNGSMKGGQASPMFPTSGKKRGCTFENPEPSSPKVTCIGQVRVKTKKQSNKFRARARSQRRAASNGGGEVSFRRVEQTTATCNNNNNSNLDASSSNRDLNNQECLPHRNQRWVHLPLTICEALREFNCFLPCRSSCMANEKGKEEKASATAGEVSGNGSSCAAVFARWLVAVQEGEGKGREIELVVGEAEEEEEFKESVGRRSYRRHVFEEIEFKEEEAKASLQEEEARVSICVPPKNALLLMRCRSDPVKMAALANKFWEAPIPANEDEADEDCRLEEKQETDHSVQEVNNKEDLISENLVSCETANQESEVVLEEEGGGEEDIPEIEEGNSVKQIEDIEKQENILEENKDLDNFINNQEEELVEDVEQTQEEEEKEDLIAQPEIQKENDFSDGGGDTEECSVHVSVQPEQVDHGTEDQEPKSEESTIQESEQEQEEEEEEEEEAETVAEQSVTTHERSESEYPLTREDQMDSKSKERESQQILPDCLLLMMCEPKLSMEVSKETWVCSTDFIRWLPEHSRPVKKKDGGDEPKKRNSIDINPPSVHASSKLQQPPRSSCSYPAKPPPRAAGAESMTTAIEKKLVGTKAYEPFVLTRCKSEPMRSASKLAPESCFWKNRKLEPHRPATLGVGAAGVGC